MHIAIVAAELNNLDNMVGDFSSVHHEFGPLEGHLLVIVCALYGLHKSDAH
jgi:hypothetical protein